MRCTHGEGNGKIDEKVIRRFRNVGEVIMSPRNLSDKTEETGKKCHVLIVIILILVLSLPMSHNALGQGVGVANDTPSFDHISIVRNNGLVYVSMIVKDLNGWEDIYNITLTITDKSGEIVSEIVYSQYSNLTATSPSVEWHELTGTYLNRELSDWEPREISPWNPENAVTPVGLDVSFVLGDVSGDYIIIKVMNRPILNSPESSCEHVGPFLQPEGNYVKINSTVYGLLISAVTFLVALLVISIVWEIRKK